MDSKVPIGASKTQVETWLVKHFPSSRRPADWSFDPETRAYYISAESVDVVGLKFPCGTWIIMVEVTLGPDDRVVSRRVTTAGVCV